MSDPMTNTDVEDVLASIRRLVSDNGRPGSATVQQPPSDRLVLTPSLRVSGEDDADESGHEEGDATEFEDAAFAQDVQDEGDDTLSTFAETAFRSERSAPDRINVRQDGFVPADENAIVAKLSANLTALEASRVADPLHKPDPDEPLVLSNDTDEGDEETTPDLEVKTQAGDTSEVSIVPEDWATELDSPETLDIAVEDDGSDAPDELLTAEVSEEDVFADARHALSETESDKSDLAAEAGEPTEKTLSEKIAALETLVGARRDQFEPDDPGTDAYAGTEPPAMEWEDVEPDTDFADQSDAEPVVAGETHSDANPDAQTTQTVHEDILTEQAAAGPDVIEAAQTEGLQPDEADVASVDAALAPQDEAVDATPAALFGSDDDVLDEEALRLLISDIVREELQGALGERITRNVRKLVRREIHRALAAQDLE